ncbi:MAG: glycosyltransferase [Chitinophagales bacterium]|nr:glycosyltransferase [Chitinophagales bacterium]
MITLLKIVFWLSVGALLHSYLLYPWLLKMFAKGRGQNKNQFSRGDDLPVLVIVLSAFNEIKVIREKLESIYKTDYPYEKIKLYIGSDASDDGTDEVIREFESRHDNIVFFPYTERSGKSKVLNKLFIELESSGLKEDNIIYIMTDANVMFDRSTLFDLVKNFKNDDIGQVGAQIINTDFSKADISYQEHYYIDRENDIKYLEGLNWGTMIGAFGACYAIRSSLIVDIPANYLMEDFYLSMNVLKENKKAILEKDAVCYEDLPGEMHEEFKRKKRISAGNFQNLSSYYKLLWPPSALSFSFVSHKVLRWLGPFFIGGAFLSSLILGLFNNFYLLMFVLQCVLLSIPVLEKLAKDGKFNSVFLKFISYFYNMNLALFQGFIMYLKGVKTNVWQPTKRKNI